jgi:hypothetical protein
MGVPPAVMMTAGAVIAYALEHLTGLPDGGDAGRAKLGTEFLRVALELLRQFPAEYVLEARVVLDHLRVEQLSSRRAALQHHCPQHGAPRVQRRRHAGRPCTDDDDFVLELVGHRRWEK